MSKNKKRITNPIFVLGILGALAGIALLFSENWLIGISGTIASASLAFKGYQDSKN